MCTMQKVLRFMEVRTRQVRIASLQAIDPRFIGKERCR